MSIPPHVCRVASRRPALISHASCRSPSEQMVSPAPEVMCVPRSPGDEFLILGTDGVWDVLTNQVLFSKRGAGCCMKNQIRKNKDRTEPPHAGGRTPWDHRCSMQQKSEPPLVCLTEQSNTDKIESDRFLHAQVCPANQNQRCFVFAPVCSWSGKSRMTLMRRNRNRLT